jgi:hypothetical protein
MDQVQANVRMCQRDAPEAGPAASKRPAPTAASAQAALESAYVAAIRPLILEEADGLMETHYFRNDPATKMIDKGGEHARKRYTHILTETLTLP